MTAISVPSFEISVGCEESVAKISVDGVLGSSVLEMAAVDGVVSVISSAYFVFENVAKRAVVKITPQSPYAFDLTNPSLIFLFDIYKSFSI